MALCLRVQFFLAIPVHAHLFVFDQIQAIK